MGNCGSHVPPLRRGIRFAGGSGEAGDGSPGPSYTSAMGHRRHGQGRLICWCWRRGCGWGWVVFGDLPSAFVFAFVDGGAGFAVGFAAFFGFALVPLLFAFGDGQFAFDAAVAEIEADGDERMPFDLRLDV